MGSWGEGMWNGRREGLSGKYFSYFSTKIYVVVLIRSASLTEALLMSTHSICFCDEIKKKKQYLLFEKSSLSGAMVPFTIIFNII